MGAIVAAFAALGGVVILAAFVVSVARGDGAEADVPARRGPAVKQASLSLSNCHLPKTAKGAGPDHPRIWQLSLYCRN